MEIQSGVSWVWGVLLLWFPLLQPQLLCPSSAREQSTWPGNFCQHLLPCPSWVFHFHPSQHFCFPKADGCATGYLWPVWVRASLPSTLWAVGIVLVQISESALWLHFQLEWQGRWLCCTCGGGCFSKPYLHSRRFCSLPAVPSFPSHKIQWRRVQWSQDIGSLVATTP
jgi:hypothetical protein